MPAQRHTFTSAVHLILEKDGEILLLQRQNTGFADGNYSLVAGHIDANEPATLAMIREAKEEATIDLSPDQLEIVHVSHRKGTDNEKIDFFIRAKDWLGTPQIGEPDKCSDLHWFPLNALPKNTVPYIQKALTEIHLGNFYSEFGW